MKTAMVDLVMIGTAEYWWALLTGIIIGIPIGISSAVLLSPIWRKRMKDGKELIFPVPDHRPIRERLRDFKKVRLSSFWHWARVRWLILLMAVMVFLGLLQGVAFNVQQRHCNDRLWQAIITRAQISDQQDAVRKDNDQAVYDMFNTWLSLAGTSTGPLEADKRDQAIAAIQSFEKRYTANQATQDKAAEIKAQNPLPRC